MAEKLQYLPIEKQEELEKLTSLLSTIKDVEMVILFGSYARDEWVEDKYIEKGITYEYRSDYDLLVVLRHEDMKQKFRIEKKVKEQLVDTGKVTTPVNMIFHGIKQLNQSLSNGNYFFKDIRKEGIVLYDTENHKLAHPRKLKPEQYQKKAQEYFDQWFKSAEEFFEFFEIAFKKGNYNIAAFLLHQAVERYYTTILLVFTDYRPKDHNLESLGIKVEICDKRFLVFPKETEEDKQLFDKLNKAYLDARYNMDEYTITKGELEKLASYVLDLKKKTDQICREKIKQIGELTNCVDSKNKIGCQTG